MYKTVKKLELSKADLLGQPNSKAVSDFIEIKLKEAGFDLTKEVRRHTDYWSDNYIFTQFK